ncbi:uncharacterized protein AB675_7287 [Cyphellophora attinorum]|uniref:Uncharacterized protein n=1 Tax=Cyphellophora attinorum TaxID=1664694 RepID=A0A0N1HJ28_9EURO|nr:uncharacterized protein AB675_7287 [Phialophora attinorum]KPI36314.1 hypothetical protein AB675_7287 [Phialophora attinorum]
MANPDTADKQLMGLPTELLQMIFKEVFRATLVPCKPLHTSIERRFHQRLWILYPSSVNVSKSYLAEAKRAILQHSTIDLQDRPPYYDSGNPPKFTFSADFCCIRHLRVSCWWNEHLRIEEIKSIVRGAPRLRRLTLEMPTYAWVPLPGSKHAGLITDPVPAGHGRSQRLAFRLPPKAASWIRPAFASELRRCFGDDYDACQFAGVLLEWLARNKSFELCTEIELRDEDWYFAQPLRRSLHLFTACYSTRTHALTITPGMDNYLEAAEEGPDYHVYMKPSVFDTLVENFVRSQTKHHYAEQMPS